MRKKAVLLFISCIVILGLVTSCAQKESPPTTSVPATSVTTSPTTAAPAPIPSPTAKTTTTTKPVVTTVPTVTQAQPQGILNVGLSSFSSEIFYIDQGTGGTEPVQGVYESLLGLDSNGKSTPQLAEKWEMSPDAKNWTFTLRQGVQFQDSWGEFTASDVKFSVEEGGKTGSLNTYVRNWVAALDNMEVVGANKIIFHFKTPYVPMESQASGYLGIPMLSQKYVQSVGVLRAGKNPVGTGPFQFVELISGDSVKMLAVNNHWRQTPQFKNLNIRLIPDSATMVALLKTRQIDIAPITIESMADVEASGCRVVPTKGVVALFVGLGGQYLPTRKTFDPSVPWVGNPSDPASMDKALKVRQALALGIDRESILRNVLKGKGTLYAVPLFNQGQPWTDPAWKPMPFDQAKAKQLLTEAGYPSGLTLDLNSFTSSLSPENPTIAQAIAMQWAQIGVKANIKLVDYIAWAPNTTARTVTGAFTHSVQGNSPEPYTIYSNLFYSKSPRYWGIEDLRLDAIEDKIVAEPDAAKRAVLQKQWGQLMYDNTWIIPTFEKDILRAVGPRVGQWQPMPGVSFFRNPEYATRAN